MDASGDIMDALLQLALKYAHPDPDNIISVDSADKALLYYG